MKNNFINMCEKTKAECIECNLCKRNCDFLTKFNIHLKDFTERPELASYCFLCDKCKDICPKKLSGKEIAIELKQKSNSEKFNLALHTTKLLKNYYICKNVSKKKSKTVLFLGCNYPAVYPQTCTRLIEIAGELNIDFMIDCCKKPIADMGGIPNFDKLKKTFELKNTKKIICTCPNCYYFLKKNLEIEVQNVFEFLFENKIGQIITTEANVFLPCPDRYKREIFSSAEKFLPECKTPFSQVQCCGLGGLVGINYPRSLTPIKNNLQKAHSENIYTYCSSCSIMFTKYGLKNVKNILSEILGVGEKVASNRVVSRIKSKFIMHKF